MPLSTAFADHQENAKVTISGSVPKETAVDKDGFYSFADLPPGSYKVTASHAWYRSDTQIVELRSGESVEVNFHLQRGNGTIKGRVLRGGKGVSQVTLHGVNSQTGYVASQFDPGADGSYTMKVPAGMYQVKAAALYPEQQPEFKALVDAYNKASQPFVVEPDATVTHDIILETSLTGTWTINSWGSHQPGPQGPGSSGEWGRVYKIAVKQENKTLTGKGTDVTMGQTTSLTGEVNDSKVTFTIPEKFPVAGSGYADLRLKFNGTVSGTQIKGTFQGGFDIPGGGNFRANGQFVASVGSESEVTPSPTPRLTTPPPTPTPTPVQGPSTIWGAVYFQPPDLPWGHWLPLTTAYNENPENAVVTVSGPVERVQTVDEKGIYTFNDLPPGEYQITASARWYESATWPPKAWGKMSLAGATHQQSFLLEREKGTIKGRVLASGRGVEDARLEASYAPTAPASWVGSSVADGSYSIEVPWGRCFVFVDYVSTMGSWFSWDTYNQTAPSLVVAPGATVIHDVNIVPLMQVERIDMSKETRQEGTRAQAIVKVRDHFGPLGGVKVYGHWSEAYSGSASATTDGEGRATVMTDWIKGGVRFIFTVDKLEKTGWQHEKRGPVYEETGRVS